MPGEPLGVTWPVTSYLDTFSLAPPSAPLSSFAARYSALSSHGSAPSNGYQRKFTPPRRTTFAFLSSRISSASYRRGICLAPLVRETVSIIRLTHDSFGPLRSPSCFVTRNERKSLNEFTRLRMTFHCCESFSTRLTRVPRERYIRRDFLRAHRVKSIFCHHRCRVP